MEQRTGFDLGFKENRKDMVEEQGYGESRARRGKSWPSKNSRISKIIFENPSFSWRVARQFLSVDPEIQ